MADIVVGVGTSHGPLLNTPPDQWRQRAAADRRNPALAFRGKDYTFDELAAVREDFSAQCDPVVQGEAHRRCREAIDLVGDVIRDAQVDALVVVSSDHKETFDDELLPQFAFYWGETMQHEPFTQEALDAMPPGLAIAEVANVPEVSTTRTVDADLALHLIRATSAAGFDPAASRVLPKGRYGDRGIPHGWGFVYQNLLRGSGEIPFVPLFVNTFWEPNPPNAARCHAFGQALGQAIRSYPRDIRVGVVASGGLSHFVVDEELDRAFLNALVRGDSDYLSGLEDEILRSGTSEMRNWIVTAAATESSDLSARVVDYQPCYRSEAGTGCAMAFMAWEPKSGIPL
jgi:hypothetical protein